MDAKLQRKLKRLGVVKGLRTPRPSTPEKPPAFPQHLNTASATEATVPGEVIETDYGPVWVERVEYASTHQQGRYRLGDVASLSQKALALLGTADLGAHPAFLDTETTGLARGTGTLAFLIGVGIWEDTKLALHLIFLRDPGEEPAVLHYLADSLSAATGLVTFNGRGFDVPLLENRFILNRIVPNWTALPHLDLLSPARTLWREHLPSRRLGVLETEILDIVRTGEDIPAWMIPDLYRQFLRDGDTPEVQYAMTRIFYHNRIDVLSLVTLLVHMARLVDTPEHIGPEATEWIGLGRLYDRNGHADTALAAWERAVSGDDGEELDAEVAARVWKRIGLYHKRQENWAAALHTWERWIQQIPWAIDPLVEKAKYYEWKAHDLAQALKETERALRRVGLPANQHKTMSLQRLRWLAKLEHRRARLQRKCARADEASDS